MGTERSATSEDSAPGINARVRAQYEAFPYPHYPLWLPLRAQEAYASNSLFAARLVEQQGGIAAVRRSGGGGGILLAGCGDVFPRLAASWEPRALRLTAVDISARSLRRARLRCLPRLRAIAWRQGNLEDPDFPWPAELSHIDSYGVLHHLAHPARALENFARALRPGGTARIMVYNSGARSWLRHLQKAFDLLGLSAHEAADLESARRILERAAEISPALRERFASMRPAFADPARFVDTFMHAREARLDLGYWLRAAAGAGLRAVGLFDRHAELDDLENPLLAFPAEEALRERVADRRFENNLELYLVKPDQVNMKVTVTHMLPWGLFPQSPPVNWFAYPETQAIPWMARRRLWWNFLRGISGRARAPVDAWAARLGPSALQRLGRLGALFPDDFASAELRALLRRPLHASMEPPDFAAPGPLESDRALRTQAAAILAGRGLPERRLALAMRRLAAAQLP